MIKSICLFKFFLSWHIFTLQKKNIGVRPHEIHTAVKDSFKKMLADGVYKADLFSDL